MTGRQAAERYQVPRTTMNDRVSAIKNNKEISSGLVMGCFHNTYSTEQEEIC